MGSGKKTISYRFDAVGNRVGMTDPDGGRFTYAYDAVNRITHLENPQGDRTSYGYDAGGRRSVKKLANGTRASFSYDAAGNLTTLANLKSDNTVISSFDYAYDRMGNRTSVVEADGSRVTWTYDATYQLTGEHRTGSHPYEDSYSYDAAGNRLLKVHDGARTTSSYDAANQIRFSDDASGRTTYTFDADGNQTGVEEPNGDRTTTSWDFENRTTLVEQASGIRNTMAYEPGGLRVKLEESTGTKKFVWDEQNYLAETDENDDTQAVYTNEPRVYGNLVSQRRGSDSHWYHFDAIGSTRELTDNTEVVTDTRLYDAWGTVVDSSGLEPITLGFVGQLGYIRDVADNSLYIRERRYSPTLGIWKSADPSGVLHEIHLYRYAGNRPTFATDPSGLWTIIGRPGLTLGAKFRQWYDLEKGDEDWWKDLPKCPCEIMFDCAGQPLSPDADVWNTPTEKKDFPKGPFYTLLELGFRAIGWIDPPDLHPTAVWDMRLKNRVEGEAGDYGNQCTYTEDGKLITGGMGAGTVDKRYYGGADYDNFGGLGDLSENTDRWRHFQHDVIPFWAAWLLDGKNYGKHVAMYLEVRPSWFDESCEAIITPIGFPITDY